MTQPSGSAPHSSPRRRSPRWRKIVYILGLLALVGTAGGAWWVWVFIHEKLAPLVSDTLSQQLQRPVQMGKLERISPFGMRFGSSSLPAAKVASPRDASPNIRPQDARSKAARSLTSGPPDAQFEQDKLGPPTPEDFNRRPTPPTSMANAQDGAYATVEAVEVGFNPWQILQRKLDLDVTLVHPEAYLEQGAQGQWLNLAMGPGGERPPIEIALKRLNLQDAKVTLSPLPKPEQARNPVKLDQVNGHLEITPNNPATNLQKLDYYLRGNSLAKGTFRLKGNSQIGLNNAVESQLQVEGQDFPVAEIDRLVRLPVTLSAGRGSGKVEVNLHPNLSFNLTGAAKFKGVNLTAPGLPYKVTDATGSLKLKDQQVTLAKTQAKFADIPVIAQGRIDPQTGFDLGAQAPRVSIPQFFKTFGIQSPVPVLGEMTANVKLTGPLTEPILTGRTRNIKPVKVDRIDVSAASANFRLDTRSQILTLQDVIATPQLGKKSAGKFSGGGQLSLRTPETIAFNATIKDVPGDAIAQLYNSGQAIPFQIGLVNATAIISGTAAAPTTAIDWSAPGGTYPASGQTVVTSNQVEIRRLVAQAYGGQVVAQGRIRDRQLQAQAQLQGITLQSFAPQFPGLFNGNLTVAGGIDDIGKAQVGLTGQADLNSGGRVNVEATAQNRRWLATTKLAGIPLQPLSADLRGILAGDLVLNGSTDDLRPGAVQVAGTVNLSKGLSLITQPIDARIAWDGRQLNVLSATAPGLQASGTVFAKLEGTPAVTGLDLNIKAQGLALTELPISLPPLAQLTGQADFDGRITGTPAQPNVKGQVAVQGLAVNGIAFAPLSGAIDLAAGRGLNLGLSSANQRINLALNSQFQPLSLDVRRGDLTITGRARGERVQVAVKELPIGELQLPGVQLPVASGQLSGNFDLNLTNNSLASSQITIQKPTINGFRGELATAQFSYRNNVLTLAQTEFVKGFSRLGLVGTLDLNGGPRFQGKATITQSEIAELLATLQLFRLNDLGRGLAAPQYARAAAVQTIPVGLPQQSLQRQFQRLSEIKVLLAQVAESRQQLIIPESLDVRGLLNGNITLDASLTQGVKADFDLQATDVAWRPYPTYSTLGSEDRPPDRVLKAETVTARGTFDNGEVNLAPVLFNLGDAQLKVSGKFGGAAPEGQVTATNLPLETIKIFYPAFNSVPSIPILDGRVNATATVNGTRENPQATGLLDLVNARLNGTPIDKGQITFGYNQARLKFGGAATVNSPEPLTVEGDIPLPLPFVAVQPTNLDVALAVNVKNQGLALLNLVIPADSVRWIDGQGELALRVSGTLLKPVIAGNLTLNNAQIKAQALPEIITGVTGTVKLEGDRIRVEQLQGQFSRGQIAVRGVLPILQPLINPESAVVEGAIEGPPAGTQAVNSLEDAARPLTVDLKQIALRLKGLYRGNVNGQLLVRGTALAPKLGGEIRLTDGQVLLPEETTDTAASGGAAGGAAGGNPITALTLDGLQLKLGDRIQVIKPPIVNFVARGNLTVNGPLSNLQPEGVINLEAGQVNIFTTQFTLARGHKQTARFIAGQGLDPELNVRLIASVPEVTRSRLPSTTLSSEVNDAPLLATNLGSLQTVRIQARVVGPASALFEKLELTSSPGRERAEIISLLGGGFINTNGRGDTTLGIANLAGSALLTNVQGLIGQALGLSEFRLFPTRTTNPRGQSSTLGLAAEAGVDITPGISASVLRVLTSSQSTQFGLRYRINDRLLFRGSTDFSGDNRAVLEYEARF